MKALFQYGLKLGLAVVIGALLIAKVSAVENVKEELKEETAIALNETSDQLTTAKANSLYVQNNTFEKGVVCTTGDSCNALFPGSPVFCHGLSKDDICNGDAILLKVK